jgi:hypothetical protein
VRLATGVVGVAGYGLAGLAAVSLLLGLYLANNTLAFASDARQAQGTVVGYFESPSNAGTRYTPRVEFIDMTGTRREFRGQMNTSVKRFAEGSQVPVRYRSSDPTQARVDLFVDSWLGAVVAWVLAALAGVSAFFLVRSAKRDLAS